jgi:hypothetical protein
MLACTIPRFNAEPHGTPDLTSTRRSQRGLESGIDSLPERLSARVPLAVILKQNANTGGPKLPPVAPNAVQERSPFFGVRNCYRRS